MLDDILANAGLTDVAFVQGAMAIVIAAAGTILGLWGVVRGLRRSGAGARAPAWLGILAVASVVAYTGWFWSVNGDGAWQHAQRYVTWHAAFAGVPLASGIAAIAIGAVCRKRVVQTGGGEPCEPTRSS